MDRYSLLVRLLPPPLHAGLSRRTNIAQIYETWKRPDVGVLYKQKAAELGAAEAERLAQYKPPQDSHDKIAAITNVVGVYTQVYLSL